MKTRFFQRLVSVCAALLLAACATVKPTAVSQPPVVLIPLDVTAGVVALAPVLAVPSRALRIGLALGGGAARGFAHVGVLKALEAAGITVDVITGTSAGSMVAVLHASGMSAAQLQSASSNMDEATLADWTLSLRGMIKGQALQNYINGQVNNQVLERMTKPVGVVATDFQSGEAVTFVRGDAGMAVRASASIPGIFSPTQIGGRTYADGGLSSPVPAKAAKQLGADVVIAIDISSRPGKPPEGLAATLNQTVAIMGQNIRIEELKAYADLVIHPNLDHVSGTDFKSRTASIAEGEAATLNAMAQIKQLISATKKRLNLN
jgi:NTE family protein